MVQLDEQSPKATGSSRELTKLVRGPHVRPASKASKLFQATRDAGSLTITHKRLQQRPKRGQGNDDATVETAPARFGVLVRAKTEKKKLSTVVAGADLVKFQAQLAAVVRANASALKKKERAKKKHSVG